MILVWEKLEAAGRTEGVGGYSGGSSRDPRTPWGRVGATAHSMERQGVHGWQVGVLPPNPAQPPCEDPTRKLAQHKPRGWGHPGKTSVPPPALSQGLDVWSDIPGCFWEDVFSEKINI